MDKLEKALVIIPIFLGGGLIYLLLGFISEQLPNFFRWANSLPIWGLWVIYLIFGLIGYSIYKKLPEPKDS